MRILFQIEILNIKEGLLFVECKIEDVNKKEFIQLYLGKVKYSALKCDNFIQQKKGFALINTNNCKNVKFSYVAKIGNLSKHGHGGEVSNSLITFAGEQVCIFPVETLTIDDKNNKVISNITISFKFKNYNYSIFPFKYNENKLSIDSPIWIDVYDIMKSSYTFGNFTVYENVYDENTLKIFNENNLLSREINLNIIEDIKNLYRYYCNIFKANGMNLSLVLLNKSIYDEKYVLGGSGVSTIAATFNHENIRDWQLLAHRMFHAFMDYKLKNRELHIPPNLWLTEGLATYYEITSLNSLSNTRKKDLNIDSEFEFKKLFSRYLYMKLRDVNISNIIPMNERNIKSYGSIEFLHYTLAPLIVKLIECKYSNFNRNIDIIQEMILLNEYNNFSMENLFYKLLKVKTEEFARGYLFGNEVLPLWFLGEYNLDKKKIIEDLNYYEYILWTWFKLENENYVQYIAKEEGLEKIANLTNIKGINFANIELENKVKEFSTTVYNLIAEYALRANICSINYNDIKLREYILGNEKNIVLWNEFLKDNLIKLN